MEEAMRRDFEVCVNANWYEDLYGPKYQCRTMDELFEEFKLSWGEEWEYLLKDHYGSRSDMGYWFDIFMVTIDTFLERTLVNIMD